jgi:DNA-binding response OmpR family regulator
MAEAKTVKKSAAGEGSVILIAEDDRFLSRGLSDKLQRKNFVVVAASDGNEALAKLREKKIDLILLDLIMPNKDGFQVLAEMRTDKKYDNLPVIILSNLGQEKDIEEGKRLGATDYLVKSNLSIEDVVVKVKETLAKAKK